MKNFTVEFSAGFYEALEIQARYEGKSVKEMVQEVMSNYFTSRVEGCSCPLGVN